MTGMTMLVFITTPTTITSTLSTLRWSMGLRTPARDSIVRKIEAGVSEVTHARGIPREFGTVLDAYLSNYMNEAPLCGARDQYSVFALQLKKPRPAPPSIVHLYRPGPRARRLIAGPWECEGPVFTPRYYRGEINPESCCTDFAVHSSIMSRT